MADIGLDTLNQKAVLFAHIGRMNGKGDPILQQPVEIKCYWPQNASVWDDKAPDVVVLVDRKIETRSQMWRGSLQAWFTEGFHGDDADMFEVKEYNETPDIKGKEVVRDVHLMKKKRAR